MKENLTDRRRLPRYSSKLQVKEINGSPVMGAYLLDIGPLGARLRPALPFNATDLVELIVLLTDKERGYGCWEKWSGWISAWLPRDTIFWESPSCSPAGTLLFRINNNYSFRG